jgi:hypothetical protein
MVADSAIMSCALLLSVVVRAGRRSEAASALLTGGYHAVAHTIRVDVLAFSGTGGARSHI